MLGCFPCFRASAADLADIEAAEARLDAALQTPHPDLQELEAALAEARDVGLQSRKIEEGQRILHTEREESRAKAEAALRTALAGRNPGALRKAIDAGRSAGLDQDALAEACRNLEEWHESNMRARLFAKPAPKASGGKDEADLT